MEGVGTLEIEEPSHRAGGLVDVEWRSVMALATHSCLAASMIRYSQQLMFSQVSTTTSTGTFRSVESDLSWELTRLVQQSLRSQIENVRI